MLSELNLHRFTIAWHKIRALPPFELVWALPSWLLLGLGRCAVLAVPFRRLAPRLGVSAGVDPWLPLLAPGQKRRARMIGRVVRRSARFTPWVSNCFNQAIAARVLACFKAMEDTERARRNTPPVENIGSSGEFMLLSA